MKSEQAEITVRIPLSYLLTASTLGLQTFEQNRLCHASNLEKEIRALSGEQKRAQAEAEVARWLIDNRDELLRTVGSHVENATEILRNPRRDPVGDAAAHDGGLDPAARDAA